MTSGLETEWYLYGRKGRDGQKKKIGKANERKGKVKGEKDEEVNGQGGKRGAPAPHGAEKCCRDRVIWRRRVVRTSLTPYEPKTNWTKIYSIQVTQEVQQTNYTKLLGR